MYKDILLAVDLTHNESWKKPVPTVNEYAMAYGSTLQVVTVVSDFGMSIVAAYFPKDHEKKALVDAGGMQGEASRLHQGAHSRRH
jgi:hypothetical protein